MQLPSHEQNPHGFHRRYNVEKADGSPVDPNAVYLVLRIDGGGNDWHHQNACQTAARAYAHAIKAEPGAGYMRQVADELLALLDR